MKTSPFNSFRELAVTLIKAVVIAGIINILGLALGWDPVEVIVRWSTWELQSEGRARLAYPSDFQNGQLPVDALLAAHALSEADANDFNVIVLGESGVAGWGLEDDETLSAQMTAAGWQVEGQGVTAYNLAYPQPNAARDLLILNGALAYDVDMVLWFLSPSSLNNAPDPTGANRVFFNINRSELGSLLTEYDPLLGGWYDQVGVTLLDGPEWWEPYFFIRDTDLLPVWFNSLFYPYMEPDIARFEERVGLQNVPETARYRDDMEGFNPMPNATWNNLIAGCRMAAEHDARLVLVNGPILIGTGGSSDTNYNSLFERALYDRYRKTLRAFAIENGLSTIDVWNIIPPEHFTDTPQHADREGFSLIVDVLEHPLIEFSGEEIACP